MRTIKYGMKKKKKKSTIVYRREFLCLTHNFVIRVVLLFKKKIKINKKLIPRLKQ